MNESLEVLLQEVRDLNLRYCYSMHGYDGIAEAVIAPDIAAQLPDLLTRIQNALIDILAERKKAEHQ